ncbi:hypothetical protein IMAU10216_03291 [Lactiplantibacillus plantarum]|nr:hypothetical protein [Lactiplantibacillus plantarum]
MPWNEQNYPPSMKNLKKVVRKKAIEIANALKEKIMTISGPFQLLRNKRKNGINIALI